jgi:protein-S-isoprenylcysteine O-methyltransferase Ste14
VADLLLHGSYAAGVVAASVIRHVYTRTSRARSARVDRTDARDRWLTLLAGVGMLGLPLLNIATGLLDFADFTLPEWMGWMGMALYAGAIWLLWRAHVDLGNNWAATVRILERHRLITEGVYTHLRHPMYAAHWLWAVAQFFLLQNWLAGPAFLITLYPFYRHRVPLEERMLAHNFGSAYREYESRTGRIFFKVPWLDRLPRLMRWRSRGKWSRYFRRNHDRTRSES